MALEIGLKGRAGMTVRIPWDGARRYLFQSYLCRTGESFL